jgi:hypothetical protein
MAPQAAIEIGRGAAYATSEVTILPDRLVNWDRGFDAPGGQVSGATEGGYVFLKHLPAAEGPAR